MTIDLAKPPSPSDLQTATDIDRMIRVLEINGWIQRAYYDRDQAHVDRLAPAKCRVDMYGALNIAICGVPVPYAPLDDAQQRRYWNVVRAISGHLRTIGFLFWQHDHDRTEADVFAALRATATALRGEVAS